MKLSDIHNLIRYNHYIKSRTEKELLTIYENALHSLMAHRDEVVDLLSDRPRSLESYLKVDDKLGLQNIDNKISEAFPNLSETSRLLLYNIVQSKIARLTPDYYDLATLTGNKYKSLSYVSTLTNLLSTIPVIGRALNYRSALSMVITTIEGFSRTIQYVSDLALSISFVERVSQNLSYKASLIKNVSILNVTTEALSYVSKLIPSIKKVSTGAVSLSYQASLTPTVRFANEYDSLETASYYSDLTLTITKE